MAVKWLDWSDGEILNCNIVRLGIAIEARMERENDHLKTFGKYMGVKFEEDGAPDKKSLGKKTKSLLRGRGAIKAGKR